MPRSGNARCESFLPEKWNIGNHPELKQDGRITMALDLRESLKDVLRADTTAPQEPRLGGDGSQIANFQNHALVSHQRNVSSEGGQDNLSAHIQQISVEKAPDLLKPSIEPGAMPPKSFKIAIKASHRILLVDSSEVIAVEAQASYVILHRQSGSVRGRGSISAMARDLEPRGFVRIHRSVLVNRACIQEIRRAAGGEYLLYTSGGMEFRVSRTCMRNLRTIAQVWIGTGTFSGWPDARRKPFS